MARGLLKLPKNRPGFLITPKPYWPPWSSTLILVNAPEPQPGGIDDDQLDQGIPMQYYHDPTYTVRHAWRHAGSQCSLRLSLVSGIWPWPAVGRNLIRSRCLNCLQAALRTTCSSRQVCWLPHQAMQHAGCPCRCAPLLLLLACLCMLCHPPVSARL